MKAGLAQSVTQLVREAVAEYVDKMGAGKLLNLRTVSPEQARREVEAYLRSHPGVVWPDEMAEELGIDYRIVLSVVQNLLKEGRIEEAQSEVIHV